MSFSKFLAVSVLLVSSVSASPLERRQDVTQDDYETLAALDPVRSAVDYASLYYAQNPATLTAIKTGASATDASFVSTSTVAPGANAGAPPDPTQGTSYQVDHIVELQFLVGAFSVNPRPTEAPTSVPSDAWTSASNAIFSSKKGGFPAQSTIASSLSNLKNLQAIPNRVNGFKQQVFTGRLKNQPGNPSGNTYPTYFGKALQKLLSDQQDAMFTVIDGVGDALAANGAGNNPAVKAYFGNYSQAQYKSAITFLDTWVGKSDVGTANATSSAAAGAASISASNSAVLQSSAPAVASTTSAAPLPASSSAVPCKSGGMYSDGCGDNCGSTGTCKEGSAGYPQPLPYYYCSCP